MKLLLTSAGIKNAAIAQAVLDLSGLRPEEVRLCFIPTAAHVEAGDKEWLIDDLHRCTQLGYASVDIVDIAAVPREIWYPRLAAANVLCFGGGNEQYLARVMRVSGLSDDIRDLLKTRLYVGISAGSMVAGLFPSAEILATLYPEDRSDAPLEPTLELVPLRFVPHLNSAYFTHVREEVLASLPQDGVPLYALDDETALAIEDGRLRVIGSGARFTRT